jgi:alpha-ribazole phosphatase
MRLYLVRHPPPLVAAGICYGSSDLPVMPQEHAQAVARLHPLLPQAAAVFSSPLVRCAGLASPLAAALGSVPVQFDARLVEMDFGAWEMRGWDGIAREEIDAWCGDRLGYRPGGGETVLEVARRVTAFCRDLARRDQGHAVVVCHAGTIRMLQAAACHDKLEDIARHAFDAVGAVGYGQLHILDIAQDF